MPREPDADRLVRRPLVRTLLATRPAFLLLAAVGVGIGLAVATGERPLDAPLAALTLLGALTFHAAVNVDNDYHDARNGTDADNADRLFPFTGGSRMIQNGALSPEQTQRLAWLLYAATALIGLALLTRAGLPLLWLGLAGALLGWAYSAPPLALNSRGLGEITVGLGFGLLMPMGADLVQRGTLGTGAAWAGAGYALMTVNLLLLNEFPDADADRQAGKRHLVVRLGRSRARWIYVGTAVLAYATPMLLVATDRLPTTALLPLAALPLTVYALRRLWQDAERPERLAPPIRATIAATLLFGTLTAVGLLLD
ncbi:prenyltransferase [Guyparkeria sp.]|uniref:prenyltransferase n=1 Tax=Guyparkeria sp. TaxID=2035736 RepID=UPI003562B918